MQIKKILDEMGIENKIYGDDYFESLGLASSESNMKMCTFMIDTKYLDDVSDSVVLILTTEENKEKLKEYNLCIVKDPRNTFFMLHNYLSKKEEYKRDIFKTIISEKATIHNLACVAENNVTIEDGAIIEEFVSIKENTIVGKNSVIRAGSIIGGEGFEFKRNSNTIYGVQHLGGVVINENVEIQQNTCIDKAIYPWDNTVIDDYTKIDNNVHIAHGVKIAKRVMVVANSGIGGRVEIGNDSWIGFNVTIRNGLKIGNNARCNMGAVVTKDVNDNEQVTGNFAIKHSDFIANLKK